MEYYDHPLARLVVRLARTMSALPVWTWFAAQALLIATPLLPAQVQPATVTVIRAGKLFDPESGRLLDHPVVVIAGNRVESVGTGTLTPPAGAQVIDLGDATLLPGFIDVHTHLTINAGSGGYEGLGVSVPRSALTGAKNARITLLAGFTTVRNVGAEGYSDVALRDAINAGDVGDPACRFPVRPWGLLAATATAICSLPSFTTRPKEWRMESMRWCAAYARRSSTGSM